MQTVQSQTAPTLSPSIARARVPRSLLVAAASATRLAEAQAGCGPGARFYGVRLRPPRPWRQRGHPALRGRARSRGSRRHDRRGRRIGIRLWHIPPARCWPSIPRHVAAGQDQEAGAIRAPFIIDNSRPPTPADFAGQLDALLAQGAGAMRSKLWNKNVGLPAEMIAQFRGSPMWPGLEAAAHTLPYDIDIMGDTQSGRPVDR